MELFDIIAGVASVIGLGISVWTLKVAQSARKAALEAKEAIYEGNAAEELHLLTRLANDFLNSVQNDRTAEGLVRSRDIIAGIALSKQRWSSFLDKGSKTKLEKASLQIRIAARVLATKGAPTTQEEKVRLVEIADEIVNLLGSEAGKLSSLQESGKLREKKQSDSLRNYSRRQRRGNFLGKQHTINYLSFACLMVIFPSQ